MPLWRNRYLHMDVHCLRSYGNNKPHSSSNRRSHGPFILRRTVPHYGGYLMMGKKQARIEELERKLQDALNGLDGWKQSYEIGCDRRGELYLKNIELSEQIGKLTTELKDEKAKPKNYEAQSEILRAHQLSEYGTTDPNEIRRIQQERIADKNPPYEDIIKGL